ncbi:sensor histidine kinase [Actinoallomurus bryophytorum]|uniref:histidine kinase n=1 Tax=Actinoallomurus bryophytorum TaxID=1490222 RepID=A0A543CIH7_9ACTN|nr:histidine kinase [Actinoallomurus bryophytorum]TQL96904.1 signal transduction histidine kinase [Actinoallomurus bryophytorum]
MFARVFAWLRRHQTFVDLTLMLPLIALALAVRPRYVEFYKNGLPHEISLPIHLALALVMCVPLIWRRRWPRAVFALIALVAFGQWLLGIGIGVNDFAVLIAMYTIAAQCAFRWAFAAGLVVEAGLTMATYSQVSLGGAGEAEWKSLLPTSIGVWAVWLAGSYISTRRKYTLSLEERAKRLERERDAQAEVAAAAERARIAREMHDVIAHSISVMVIQADGASFTVDTDAERAKRAMQAIGTTGRQALTEMRRMLGVLREGDGQAALAPQPGVDQLSELVGQMRNTGLPVELAVRGSVLELPGGMELAVYRIVQEALTNVMKHAGPSASAWVDLHYGDQAIEVRVRDDGRGATFSDGRGHGLLSMRERAAVYGGQVSAEPVPGGGFEVIARLRVKEEVKA